MEVQVLSWAPKNKMTDFQKQKYTIVKNFFTKEECNLMYHEYKDYCQRLNLKSTTYIETAVNSVKLPILINAYQVFSYVLFVEKLCEIVPRVNKIVGEKVLPTYALGRFYNNGGYLREHRDRPECEVSLTVNLSQDKPWGIWLSPNLEDDAIEVIQEPGDALFYHGHESYHYRKVYDGEEYCQVFFHYVKSRGKFVQRYFDRPRMNLNNHEKDIKGVGEDI